MSSLHQTASSAEYFRPDTLENGLALLAQKPLRVVAGATDIYPLRVAQRAWGAPKAESWLDISAIESLRGITATHNGWRIGAMVTWSELVAANLPACFDGLKAAAREVGGLQIQNRATLAGNLCNASPAADGVPPLLCLDASVELSTASATRRLPLSEFILGNRQTARRPNELLTAIHVPSLESPFLDSRFFKLGARKYLVISIVMAASIVQWDDSHNLTDCRFSIGSCSPVAMRLPSLEKQLIGLNLDDMACGRVDVQELLASYHFEQLSPIDDVRADATYRYEAAINCLAELLGSHTRSFSGAAI